VLGSTEDESQEFTAAGRMACSALFPKMTGFFGPEVLLVDDMQGRKIRDTVRRSENDSDGREAERSHVGAHALGGKVQGRRHS
jgi:hypothetical protein